MVPVTTLRLALVAQKKEDESTPGTTNSVLGFFGPNDLAQLETAIRDVP